VRVTTTTPTQHPQHNAQHNAHNNNRNKSSLGFRTYLLNQFGSLYIVLAYYSLFLLLLVLQVGLLEFLLISLLQPHDRRDEGPSLHRIQLPKEQVGPIGCMKHPQVHP